MYAKIFFIYSKHKKIPGSQVEQALLAGPKIREQTRA